MPCLQASIKRQPLKAGDTVSVAATVFGIEWAKKEYPGDWRHRKLQGQVTGKAGAKWKLHFAADGTTIVLPRQDITAVPSSPDSGPLRTIRALWMSTLQTRKRPCPRQEARAKGQQKRRGNGRSRRPAAALGPPNGQWRSTQMRTEVQMGYGWGRGVGGVSENNKQGMGWGVSGD